VVDSRPNVWQLQSRHDKQGLLEALRYPDPEVRGRAAVALRTLSAVDAVPVLKDVLRTETDEQARRNMTMALHMLDRRTDVEGIVREKDVDRLIGVLKSRNPDSVITAAQALGVLGNRLAVEPLVILFHNASTPPAVRLAAAEALLELKSAPAVVTLLGALRRDSWEVRRNAAAVLGQIQAVWAVAPLAAALDDPHPVVRRSAAVALKRIGTAEAVAALRARFAPTTLPEALSSPEVTKRTASKPAHPQPDKAAEARQNSLEADVREQDTRPVASRSSLADEITRPVIAVPRRSKPEPLIPMTGQPTGPQPPAQLTITPPPPGPVKRLIAFLKRRSDESGEDHPAHSDSEKT
jgi:HEAT repeat protein